MKRRKFIQSSSAVVLSALFILPDVTSALNQHPEDALLASPNSLKLLKDKEAIYDIGCTYRNLHPHEDNKEILIEHLRKSLGHDVSDASIKHLVSLDFEEGHVVQVNGWILSHTEARQCALYSILY